jgi:hypothetical protein
MDFKGLKDRKGKVVPLRSIEAHLDDRRYSSYSSLTSTLEGGEVEVSPWWRVSGHFSPNMLKSMVFENTNGKGTREKFLGRIPWSKKSRRLVSRL